MTNAFTLLPEWSPQEAVMLSWPDAETDWAYWLPETQQTYLDIIQKLNHHACPVILLARENQTALIKSKLSQNAKVLIVQADYNDTWIRDYGFLSIKCEGAMHPVNFQFNGWGAKFDAQKDNDINQNVLAKLCQNAMTDVDIVVEGGALEINSEGVLLSTEFCLTNPKRNGELSLNEYEAKFEETLGARKTIILNNGHLEGDDTDGHIDTLARFTPENHLVIQSAFNRPEDSHYQGLNALVEECKSHFPGSVIFELPLPYISNDEGERLPASYANYLISNNNIFAPVYGHVEDDIAINVLQKAYPEFEVVPVNCRTLVEQFGSLHCISMQVPTNTLKTELIEQLHAGVTIYG